MCAAARIVACGNSILDYGHATWIRSDSGHNIPEVVYLIALKLDHYT